MAKGIQTANGKAFEYACILALYEELHSGQDIVVEQTESLHTAQKLYGTIEESIREALDAAARYYKPVLQSFMNELKRIEAAKKERIPKELIHYLLGRFDFYKVITDDKNRTTRVEAMNINGTLNRISEAEKSILKIPLLKMPAQFYHIDFKPGSNNTIEVVCDGGWQISMRIHSASSKVEPSLKFDVNLISVPSSVHTQVEPWDTGDAKRTVRLGLYTELMLNNE